MTDAVRIGLVTIGAATVGIGLGLLTVKWERSREARTSPEAEAQRAREIALNIGSLVVALVQAAAGLVIAAAGMALFVGLLIGMVTLELGLQLGASVIVAFPVYLWAMRVADGLK